MKEAKNYTDTDLSRWTGMQIQTFSDWNRWVMHIKITDFINGHKSSVTTAFTQENMDELRKYVATVKEAFEQIRKITKK